MINFHDIFNKILSTIRLGTVFYLILQNFLCNCGGLIKTVGQSSLPQSFYIMIHSNIGNCDNRDLNEKVRYALSEVESLIIIYAHIQHNRHDEL